MAWNKPLPHPTETSAPFWEGLKAHQVRIQQCEDCSHWIFFPRAHCPACASRRLAWRDVSGEGTLYTYTVARVPTLPTPTTLCAMSTNENRVSSAMRSGGRVPRYCA